MNHKHIIALSIILFVTSNIFSQEEIKTKELMKLGAYDIALPKLLEELKQNPADITTKWQIATCYLETNYNKKAAVEYIESALENGLKENEAILDLSEAYLHAGRFDESIKKAEEYKTLVKESEKQSIADKYISFAQNAKKLTQTPINVEFVNLGDKVNSNRSDFSPAIDLSETEMIFGTNRRYIADWGENVFDVQTTDFKFGKWKRARSLSSKINNTDHQFFCGSSPDLNTIFVRVESYESSGDLFYVERDKNRYDELSKIKGFVNGEKSIEEAACMTLSGDTLYFSSDREGGLGGQDIYYSIRIGDSWGVPQNMGPTINTPYNDNYPTISVDSKTFTFASEGHNSMGGYDLYKSSLNIKTNEWSKPQNIGYPINSTYDDINISMSQTGRHAYIASVRDGGEGEYDIYKLIFLDVEPNILTYTGLIAVGDTAVSTKITDLTKECKVTVEDNNGEIFGEYQVHQRTSTYVIALPPGKYTLKINAGIHGKVTEKIVVPDDKFEDPIIHKDYLFAPPPPPKKTDAEKKAEAAKKAEDARKKAATKKQ